MKTEQQRMKDRDKERRKNRRRSEYVKNPLNYTVCLLDHSEYLKLIKFDELDKNSEPDSYFYRTGLKYRRFTDALIVELSKLGYVKFQRKCTIEELYRYSDSAAGYVGWNAKHRSPKAFNRWGETFDYEQIPVYVPDWGWVWFIRILVVDDSL